MSVTRGQCDARPTVTLPVERIKIKVVSICIAPIHEPSLRRSARTGIVKVYHSFTCTPCVSSACKRNEPYL